MPNLIEFSYWEVFCNGVYEADTLKFFIDNIPDGGCFLDVGANVGLISVPLAQARPDVVIYAIEADPIIYAYLSYNIETNGLKNITALNHAIHEKDGMLLPFFTPEDKMGCGSFTPLFTRKSINLHTKTLDTLTKEYKVENIDFIKIDVEGYEYYVLKGAQELLQEHSPKILFEFVDWAEEQATDLDKGSCQRLLFELGYKIAILKKSYLEILSEPKLEGSGMLLASRY